MEKCYTEAHSFQVCLISVFLFTSGSSQAAGVPRPPQRAARRCPQDEEPGGEDDSQGFCGAIFSLCNHREARERQRERLL